MKRLALLLAAILLLSGCGTAPTDIQQPQETPPQITVPPTPDFAVLEDAHSVQILTHGAVQRYRIEGEAYEAMLSVEGGILLLSGETETVLTLVTGDGQTVTGRLNGKTVNPDTFWSTQLGLSYYDDGDHTLVFLDETLVESTRISLPEEMGDRPVLSADGQLVYYYDAGSLRCLELRSGISRLLKESRFTRQQVRKLHFDDTVLECYVSDTSGDKTLFISAETGETLFEAQTPVELQSQGQKYFARWQEGQQELLLFGTRGQTIQRITLSAEGYCLPLFGADLLLTYEPDSTGTDMICYDLKEGNRLSSLRLASIGAPLGIQVQPGQERIWFLAEDLFSDGTALYCWDLTVARQSLENSFLSPYYTAQSPDKEGLKRCQEQAKALSQTYGIRVELWEDAVTPLPGDYSVTAEYLVNVYERYLPVLEKALSAFPQTVYQKLGRQSQNGKLTVSLVREFYSPNELGSMTVEEGAHFWSGGSSYLILAMNDNLERSFYHELFHAMDSYIMTETKAYDDWRKLNPSGFAYDYSYLTNQYRDPKEYLEPDSRAFIDLYSMSYPKEDRARIMEYAMTEGNAAYFTSKIMHNKLDTLCKGIRKAFKLGDGNYLWEQYL